MWSLMKNLNVTKIHIRKWERNKKLRLISELNKITMEISSIIRVLEHREPTREDMIHIKILEGRKNEILKIQEMTWRLKSRAIWIMEVKRRAIQIRDGD